MWDDPWFLRLSKRLGGFSRTVWDNTRGVGASEGDFRATVTGERREADVLAVVDAAVGSEPVELVGWGPAGTTAIRISSCTPNGSAHLSWSTALPTTCHERSELGQLPDQVDGTDALPDEDIGPPGAEHVIRQPLAVVFRQANLGVPHAGQSDATKRAAFKPLGRGAAMCPVHPSTGVRPGRGT